MHRVSTGIRERLVTAAAARRSSTSWCPSATSAVSQGPAVLLVEGDPFAARRNPGGARIRLRDLLLLPVPARRRRTPLPRHQRPLTPLDKHHPYNTDYERLDDGGLLGARGCRSPFRRARLPLTLRRPPGRVSPGWCERSCSQDAGLTWRVGLPGHCPGPS